MSNVETDKEALIAFVRETHQVAQTTDVVERAKAVREVSEKTAADYRRVAASRINLEDLQSSRLLQGVTRQSFDHHRAALRHEAARMFSKARSLCDKSQREGDIQAALRHARYARSFLKIFEEVSKTEKPEQRSAPRKSKRKTLPRDIEWRKRAWEAATPAMKPALACALVGARPNEIEKGIHLKVLQDTETGEEFVRVTIYGAKITEKSGQPERSMVFSTKSFVGAALYESIPEDGPEGPMEALIQRRAKRISLDWSQRIRPAVGGSVSPYSLRHQFAADLKASGLDEVGIAEALGHLSVKSQQRYGSKQQGSSGGMGLISVEASREVRTGPDAEAVFDEPTPEP